MDIYEFDGVLNFDSQEGEPDSFIKTGILFKAGKHRGEDYTVADLETLAKSYDENDPTPIQIDHSSSARDTVGYVRKVWVEEDKLMGELEVIDETMRSRIEKKLNSKLSVGFYHKNNRPTRLREVSIVAFPQVKGASIFEENGGEKDMDEKITAMQEELRQQIEKEYSVKFEEMQKQLVEFQEQALEAKAKEIVAEFEEKIIPAQEESLNKLVKSFSEEQLDMFREFMEANKIVDLEEKAGQEDKVELSEQEKADLEYKAWKKEIYGGE